MPESNLLFSNSLDNTQQFLIQIPYLGFLLIKRIMNQTFLQFEIIQIMLKNLLSVSILN